MNRFQRLDNSSPVVDVAENTPPKVDRSGFDISSTKYGTAIEGELMVLDVIQTNPDEDYKISQTMALEFLNPTVRKLYNGYTVTVHTYYNRWSDLWEGAQNFVDKGRSGNISLSMPRVLPSYLTTLGADLITQNLPGSLLNQIGVPPSYYYSTSPRSNSYGRFSLNDSSLVHIGNEPVYVNGLPFMMYQRLWRDKYSPKNLTQSAKKWFPDNEDHFIIPYSAAVVNFLDYDNPVTSYDPSNPPVFDTTGDSTVPSSSGDIVNLVRKRFVQFRGDQFTTCSPFPDMVRGSVPTLDFTGSGLTATNTVSGSPVVYVNNSLGTSQTLRFNTTGGTASPYLAEAYTTGGPIPNASGQQIAYINPSEITVSTNLTGTLSTTTTLNDLRTLEAYTLFAERMGRTSGDYNAMVYAQYGYNPKSRDREAIYLGGFSFQISNDTVVQSSESSDSSALGSQVSIGQGSAGQTLQPFHSPDFGYIMTVAFIRPDTIYTQGIPRELTQQSFEDVYWPIFNNLPPQAVENQELYVSGVEATDKDVFGYAERGYYYKSRLDRASGMFSVPSQYAVEYSSRLLARRFSTTPALNSSFVSTFSNVPTDVWTSSLDIPFAYAFRNNVYAVRPMPYVTNPGGLSTRAI